MPTVHVPSKVTSFSTHLYGLSLLARRRVRFLLFRIQFTVNGLFYCTRKSAHFPLQKTGASIIDQPASTG